MGPLELVKPDGAPLLAKELSENGVYYIAIRNSKFQIIGSALNQASAARFNDNAVAYAIALGGMV